jgi:hypothetical protein
MCGDSGELHSVSRVMEASHNPRLAKPSHEVEDRQLGGISSIGVTKQRHNLHLSFKLSTKTYCIPSLLKVIS